MCWIYTSQHHGHGYINLTNAIKQSCNYFFYEMGYRMGIETLSRYTAMFGLGSRTGIELTGEKAGTIARPEIATANGEVWTTGQTLNAVIRTGIQRFYSNSNG